MKGKFLNPSPVHLKARINSIESVLETNEVDEKTHTKLIGELEKTHVFFQTYKEKASPSDFASKEELQIQLDQIQDKIVSLYGRIDSLHVDYHLNTVKKQTKNLEIALQSGSKKEISVTMKELSKLVAKICESYALLRKDYIAIEDAKEFLAKAKAQLKKKHAIEPAPRNNPFYDEEIALELLHVAHLIYNRHYTQASRLYTSLPLSMKSVVKKNHQSLTSAPLNFEKNPLEAIQSIMLTAEPLTPASSLSEKDIISFFEEANTFIF